MRDSTAWSSISDIKMLYLYLFTSRDQDSMNEVDGKFAKLRGGFLQGQVSRRLVDGLKCSQKWERWIYDRRRGRVTVC